MLWKKILWLLFLWCWLHSGLKKKFTLYIKKIILSWREVEEIKLVAMQLEKSKYIKTIFNWHNHPPRIAWLKKSIKRLCLLWHNKVTILPRGLFNAMEFNQTDIRYGVAYYFFNRVSMGNINYFRSNRSLSIAYCLTFLLEIFW